MARLCTNRLTIVNGTAVNPRHSDGCSGTTVPFRAYKYQCIVVPDVEVAIFPPLARLRVDQLNKLKVSVVPLHPQSVVVVRRTLSCLKTIITQSCPMWQLRYMSKQTVTLNFLSRSSPPCHQYPGQVNHKKSQTGHRYYFQDNARHRPVHQAH